MHGSFWKGSGRGCLITPLAVSSREASQGFSEIESLPGLADSGPDPMRDVPGHTAHLLASRLSEALKLTAGEGVLAVVDETALLNKQTAPVQTTPRSECSRKIRRHIQTPRGKSPGRA